MAPYPSGWSIVLPARPFVDKRFVRHLGLHDGP